jgi:aromatic-L-amino-acid decarboxylase
MEAVQTGGETFVTNAVLRGRFALRACVLHYATTTEDVTAMMAVVRRLGERFLNGLILALRSVPGPWI